MRRRFHKVILTARGADDILRRAACGLLLGPCLARVAGMAVRLPRLRLVLSRRTRLAERVVRGIAATHLEGAGATHGPRRARCFRVATFATKLPALAGRARRICQCGAWRAYVLPRRAGSVGLAWSHHGDLARLKLPLGARLTLRVGRGGAYLRQAVSCVARRALVAVGLFMVGGRLERCTGAGRTDGIGRCCARLGPFFARVARFAFVARARAVTGACFEPPRIARIACSIGCRAARAFQFEPGAARGGARRARRAGVVAGGLVFIVCTRFAYFRRGGGAGPRQFVPCVARGDMVLARGLLMGIGRLVFPPRARRAGPVGLRRARRHVLPLAACATYGTRGPAVFIEVLEKPAPTIGASARIGRRGTGRPCLFALATGIARSARRPGECVLRLVRRSGDTVFALDIVGAAADSLDFFPSGAGAAIDAIAVTVFILATGTASAHNVGGGGASGLYEFPLVARAACGAAGACKRIIGLKRRPRNAVFAIGVGRLGARGIPIFARVAARACFRRSLTGLVLIVCAGNALRARRLPRRAGIRSCCAWRT